MQNNTTSPKSAFWIEDYFAAHYDQADSLTVQAGDGKERYDSSHTLLIALSERPQTQGAGWNLWVPFEEPFTVGSLLKSP